jgi:hypothetical protein
MVADVTHVGVSRNIVTIGGQYDEEEEAVALYLVFHPKDKTVALTFDYWKWLRKEIGDALQHEFIHKKQATSRHFDAEALIGGSEYTKKNATPDQQYYGKPDEIEAYASNAATELKRAYGRRAKIMLKNPFDKNVRDKVPTFDTYWNAFATMDSPVVKKLLKKTYQYL